MPRNWIVGYPAGGITGPTTPATGGSTCEERVAHHNWTTAFDAARKVGVPFADLPPAPKPQTVLVTCGMETIAIVPFPVPGGEEAALRNAALIAAAPAAIEALRMMVAAFPPPPIGSRNGFGGNLAHAAAGAVLHSLKETEDAA